MRRRTTPGIAWWVRLKCTVLKWVSCIICIILLLDYQDNIIPKSRNRLLSQQGPLILPENFSSRDQDYLNTTAIHPRHFYLLQIIYRWVILTLCPSKRSRNTPKEARRTMDDITTFPIGKDGHLTSTYPPTISQHHHEFWSRSTQAFHAHHEDDMHACTQPNMRFDREMLTSYRVA